jgi:hypothetical protein
VVGVGVDGPPGVDVVAGPDLRPLHPVRQKTHPKSQPAAAAASSQLVGAQHSPSQPHPRRLYSSTTITSSIAAITGRGKGGGWSHIERLWGERPSVIPSYI